MMKKILTLSLIFVFSLALSGCTKKATQPTGVIDSTDYEQNTGDTINPSDNKTDTSDIDTGVTKEELEKLKTDIDALEYEDLSALPE